MITDISRLPGITANFTYTGLPVYIFSNVAATISDTDGGFCGLNSSQVKYGEVSYTATYTFLEPISLRGVIAQTTFERDPYLFYATERIEISTGSGFTAIWEDSSVNTGFNKTKSVNGVWNNVVMVRFVAEFPARGKHAEWASYHRLHNINILAYYDAIDLEPTGLRIATSKGAIEPASRAEPLETDVVRVNTSDGVKQWALVDIGSPAASKLRVMTSEGVKAVAQMR